MTDLPELRGSDRPPSVNPRHVLDIRTIEMLVCPLTKTRLSLSSDGLELVSLAAHLAFPIRDGVPMLSLDEAREFDPEDLVEKRRLGVG